MEASSFEAVRSIGDLIVTLNADDRIEGSSLAKFMALCNSMNLSRLLSIEEGQALESRIKLLMQKAKLALWFNVKADSGT